MAEVDLEDVPQAERVTHCTITIIASKEARNSVIR